MIAIALLWNSDEIIYAKFLVSSNLLWYFCCYYLCILSRNNYFLFMSTDNTPSILIASCLEYCNTWFALCPFLVSFHFQFTDFSVNNHVYIMLKSVFKISSKELKIIFKCLSEVVKNITFPNICSLPSFLLVPGVAILDTRRKPHAEEGRATRR